MDDETHVEHVVVEGAEPAEAAEIVAAAQAAAVAATVAAAEGAAALAHETAAAAELQAAETVATAEQEAEAWRQSLEAQALETGQVLASLNERLSEHDSHRADSLLMQDALLLRLSEIEDRLPKPEPLTREASNEDPEAPILGAETEVRAGPIAAEVGGGIGSAEPEDQPPADQPPAASGPQRRKRHWI